MGSKEEFLNPQAPTLGGRMSDRLRQAVPDAAVPAIVAARIRSRSRKPAAIETARREMEFLLGGVRGAAEVEEAAHRYLERDVWRSELRWHPELLIHQPVEGVARLKAARKTGRGVVISMLHHGHYEGAMASLGHADRPISVVVSPEMLAPDAPAFLRQHVRTGSRGGTKTINAGDGAKAIAAALAGGEAVCIATDVPGQTRLPFLGRERLGSSGAARLAQATNSLVVVMTAHHDGDGGLSLGISEAVEAKDFADPDVLLRHMIGLQESAVLAWPEGYHIPTLRWGAITD